MLVFKTGDRIVCVESYTIPGTKYLVQKGDIVTVIRASSDGSFRANFMEIGRQDRGSWWGCISSSWRLVPDTIEERYNSLINDNKENN
jgi:hypothetical protein